MDNNGLTGPIPVELAGLKRLNVVLLAHNHLTGRIAPGFGELDLHRLSLAGNELSGCLPASLRQVRINDLDEVDLPECAAAVSIAVGASGAATAEQVTEGQDAEFHIVADAASAADFAVAVEVSGSVEYGVVEGERSVGVLAGTTEATLAVETVNDDVDETDGAVTATILDGDDYAVFSDRRSATLGLVDNEGPAAPEIHTVSAGDGALTVAWAEPASEADLTRYDLRYRPLAGTWRSIELGSEVLEYTIAGLANHTRYAVEMRAVADANGAWSGTVEGTPEFCRAGDPETDCRMLLAIRDTLVGDGTPLNWDRGIPMADWSGIRISGDLNWFCGRADHGRFVIGVHPDGLAGTIPQALGVMSRLPYLLLQYNDLTGPIPPQLGDMSSLCLFSLYHNNISGPIPPELGRLANLRVLGLAENRLTGSIPVELGRLSKLRGLELYSNDLTGRIPTELGGLENLRVLRLSSNRLSGGIPPVLGGLAGLERLSLHNNDLTGPIPSELGDLANMRILDLSRNRLVGAIPPLGKLAGLNQLSLAGNDLTGPIPPELVDLRLLTILELEDNRLSGSIPPRLGHLSHLRELHLRDNRLTGQIPRTLTGLTDLRGLWLAGNNLTGCVPDALLDVAFNDLDTLGLPDCSEIGAVALAIRSTPLADDAYGMNERIVASVRFGTDMSISGSPQLALTIGSDIRRATFAGAGDGAWIDFHYVVAAADRDVDGIGVAADALSLNGGSIRTDDGTDAVLDLTDLACARAPDHKVRGVFRDLEPIPDRELATGGDTLEIDLAMLFDIPAGTVFAAPVSGDPALATVAIENGVLVIVTNDGFETGEFSVTVTATGPNGFTVTLVFEVTDLRSDMRGWRIATLVAGEQPEEATD